MARFSGRKGRTLLPCHEISNKALTEGVNMAYSKERQAQWQKENPQHSLRAGQSYRDRLKAAMVEAYGGKCIRCGIDDSDVLVLDHINDDAQIDRKENKHCGGVHMYAKLRKAGWPKDRHQLLCHNCNYKKELQRRRKSRKDPNAIHTSAT
jgi:hypothetical protein